MTVNTQSRFRLLIGLAIGVFALFPALPACAQSMDYGSLEQLFAEPVTASATGSPQRATEVPADMIIVTADEIRRSGARDIPGVLRHVAGVDVQQGTNDYADVSIRGYNQAYSSRTLVLIDGRQVYADYYGYIPWSALPVELSAIRQIEIVRGPNTALFSLNASGGVINIITKNPRYDDVSSLSLRSGTQGLTDISGVATLKLGSNSGLRLSGGYRTDNEFDTALPVAMAGTQRTENDRASFDANAVFDLGGDVELGLEASHTHARQNEVLLGFAMQTSRYETNSLKGDLTADTGIGLLKLSAYTNWIAWNGLNSPFLGKFDLTNQVTVVQAGDIFNPGTDHTVRLAVEYRHNSVNTTPIAGGTIFYDMVSGTAMWNWRITPSLALTNAARFDHIMLGRSGSVPAGYPFENSDWDRAIDETSFNSGLVWTATPLDTLRLIVGRGVQLPSLVQIGAMVIVTPYERVTGSPALKYTSVTNYELAWDRRLPDLDAQVQVSVFHEKTDNLISLSGNFVRTSAGIYATSGNVGSSSANGAEMIASGKIDGAWRWSLSYRAEFINDDLSPITKLPGNLVDYMHTTPKHLAKAGLGWADGNWETDAYLTFQSQITAMKQYGPGVAIKTTVGAYASADARVAYKLTDWATLAISGQNLLQSRQQQTSGPEVERSVFVTLSLNG